MKLESQMINKDKSVLVIDDMKFNFVIVQKVLTPYFGNLDYVQDPRLAMERILKSPPDLILLDFDMPNITGPDLCRLIKANPQTADIPVVFFTASTVSDTIREAFESGADDYLTKPICETEILSRISRILNLQALKAKLQSQFESQSAVSRVLTHDLNNYLLILSSSVSLVDKILKKAPELFEASRRPMDRMTKTCHRMAELIVNVRNIQAIDEGKVGISLSAQPLGEILKESIANFQDRLKEKQIAVTAVTDLPSELLSAPVFLEVTSALNSVIGNVLSNAIKFSPRGGHIDVSVESGAGVVELKIRDHGIGMDDSLKSKVFSKSEKTSRRGTEDEPGTGFGMPLVKMYMENYGGSVGIESATEAESPQGHGTTVAMKFKKAV